MHGYKSHTIKLLSSFDRGAEGGTMTIDVAALFRSQARYLTTTWWERKIARCWIVRPYSTRVKAIICPTWQVFWLIPLPRGLPIHTRWTVTLNDCVTTWWDIQQRVCSGVSPDSLLIRNTPWTGTCGTKFSAAKLQKTSYMQWIFMKNLKITWHLLPDRNAGIVMGCNRLH